MKKFTLAQVALACNGEFFGESSLDSTIVENITIDSRNVCEGTLFIAVKGERVDGHSYIPQTYEKGAVCVVSEQPLNNTKKPYILVSSTLQAIKDIATFYRSLFDIPFIGITGSVGKTSTKEMISAVLSQKYKVHKTQGNFNNEIGVPLTLFAMHEDTQVAVIEMGISDFGEMTNLTKIVKPTHCVLTNIGNCHLENLINLDGVLKAKSEIFKSMQKDGKVYLNGDDEKLRTITLDTTTPTFFGLGSNNAFTAKNINNTGLTGIDCTLVNACENLDVHIPAIGNYMIGNALCAYAIGKSFGLNSKEIADGIASYKTVGSRANIIKTETLTVIDDCYNANPVSIKSAIDTLANFKNRKVAILGDMKELGENEVALHCEVGKHTDEKNIDILIAIGTLAKHYAEDTHNIITHYFKTVDDAINDKTGIKTIVSNDDIVLVKASRSMKLEQVVQYLTK